MLCHLLYPLGALVGIASLSQGTCRCFVRGARFYGRGPVGLMGRRVCEELPCERGYGGLVKRLAECAFVSSCPDACVNLSKVLTEPLLPDRFRHCLGTSNACGV